MNWIPLVGGGLLTFGLFFFLAGRFLPRHRTSTRTIWIRQPPDAVFSLLVDVSRFPQWTSQVLKVELLGPLEGREVSRQSFKGGGVATITTTESVRPSRLVRVMSDPGSPFSRSWSYAFTAVNGGCTVVLTERVEYANPIFFVIARLCGINRPVAPHLEEIATQFGDIADIR